IDGSHNRKFSYELKPVKNSPGTFVVMRTEYPQNAMPVAGLSLTGRHTSKVATFKIVTDSSDKKTVEGEYHKEDAFLRAEIEKLTQKNPGKKASTNANVVAGMVGAAAVAGGFAAAFKLGQPSKNPETGKEEESKWTFARVASVAVAVLGVV